ncbi:glycogen synthase [Hesseltinella vesiculosa]|uniref:Glycogen [starch] synthase n=1 Tax=Hesseltinella vesiculosa TaxID=101127 RepID=A0A1X2GL22_9FUNG|nr:glycogen synthase [Hesseltinella vesiculosa]
MTKKDVYNPYLFECAWEVANKVGGIYTVIRTKVPITVKEYGDHYCLIGPLNHQKAPMEVEVVPDIPNPLMKEVLDSMEQQGVKYLFGRWLIEGAPYVLLFDLGASAHKLDEWKGDLWNTAGIPTPPSDIETNDAVLLGYLATWFLADMVAKFDKPNDPAVIGHFHEWQAGVAIPLIQKRKLPITTVFTTHATLLGRYLCAGSTDFYNNLNKFDVDEEAGKRGIYHRYCIERAAAHCSTVFTTVSHITAYESEHLLKRKPDGVLPNGLNVVKFSAPHQFQNLHLNSKEKINEFVRGHFYGHYDFDLDDTIYMFTAGRYEYRNKGVDMYVESLGRLNNRLKAAKSKTTVVAFIIMPTVTRSFNVEALKGQAVTKQLDATVAEIQDRIGKRIYETALRQHELKPEDLLSEEDKVLLKRRMFALKRSTLPPIVTHNIVDNETDPVLTHLRRLQLFNRPEDRVKVIFHPEFLNANNPLLGMDYEEFVRGCHLGVFPSYYEPWGYTPAECTVLGVPSISTNLSGFGCFMEENIENCEDYGIYVMDRRLKGVEESLQQLSDQMFRFCQKTRRQRINQRNRTERLSDLLDWKRMGLEYMKARQLALRRLYPDSFDEMPRPPSAPVSPRISGATNFFDDDDDEDQTDFVLHHRRKKIPAFQGNAGTDDILESLDKLKLETVLEKKKENHSH